MKRALLAITGTIAGLVALLSFKSHSSETTGFAGVLPSAGLPAANSSTGAASTSGSGPAAKTHRHTSAAPAPTSRSTPAASSRTAIGVAEQTRYGVVQVKVTIAGTKITNVSFVQLTADDGHSQMINQQAAPILLQETLQAQSAHIDGVSGASYTSAGYEASLQSALDKL